MKKSASATAGALFWLRGGGGFSRMASHGVNWVNGVFSCRFLGLSGEGTVDGGLPFGHPSCESVQHLRDRIVSGGGEGGEGVGDLRQRAAVLGGTQADFDDDGVE